MEDFIPFIKKRSEDIMGKMKEKERAESTHEIVMSQELSSCFVDLFKEGSDLIRNIQAYAGEMKKYEIELFEFNNMLETEQQTLREPIKPERPLHIEKPSYFTKFIRVIPGFKEYVQEFYDYIHSRTDFHAYVRKKSERYVKKCKEENTPVLDGDLDFLREPPVFP